MKQTSLTSQAYPGLLGRDSHRACLYDGYLLARRFAKVVVGEHRGSHRSKKTTILGTGYKRLETVRPEWNPN